MANILLKTERPIPNRFDVWESEVCIKDLTPTRRDKLVILLNLVGFVLKDITSTDEMLVGEIRDSLEGYKVKVE